MDFAFISRLRYSHTMAWAVLLGALVVALAATLARASVNIKAALTDQPDIAIYLLLPDEEIGETTLLKALENERAYIAQTKEGPKLIELKKGEHEWYVSWEEKLRE
jgi:hypothetical protein